MAEKPAKKKSGKRNLFKQIAQVYQFTHEEDKQLPWLMAVARAGEKTFHTLFRRAMPSDIVKRMIAQCAGDGVPSTCTR